MFNEGKMCVLLKKNAYDIACQYPYTSEQFRKLMRLRQGTWMDVDTSSLFPDQFNVKIRSDKTDWVRIPAEYVSQVRNDARLGKKYCQNCGKVSVYKDTLGREHRTCPNCQNNAYFYIFSQKPGTNGVIC